MSTSFRLTKEILPAILRNVAIELSRRWERNAPLSPLIRLSSIPTHSPDGEERNWPILMMTKWKAALRRVLNNRLVSLGSVAALTLILTGVLATAPAKSDLSVSAAPTKGASASVAASAMTVTVKADGKTQTLTPEKGTVEQALTAAHITLSEDDKVEPSLKTALKDGLTITVTRIEFVERVELESIPFKTVEKTDSSLSAGRKVQKQVGAEGIRERVFCDKVVNGKVESSKELRSSVVTEPTDDVWMVGPKKSSPVAKPAGVVTDASGKPKHYKSCLTGVATAYTSDRGNAGTVTASGARAQVGIVAVNPEVIPLGTKLYIASPDGSVVYGYAVAGDTGGAMYSGEALVDLFFDTYDECIRFGRRTMNVYILE